MLKFNDGGPAFPQPMVPAPNGGGLITPAECGDGGASLRDYFAAKVDVFVYSPLSTLNRKLGREATINELADYIAAIRFIEADAMIKARE
jgi:hypothetical protein